MQRQADFRPTLQCPCSFNEPPTARHEASAYTTPGQSWRLLPQCLDGTARKILKIKKSNQRRTSKAYVFRTC